MATFAELWEKYGPSVQAISTCVVDFRYGPVEELARENLWAIPSAGLIVLCAEGLRPLDVDAVSLAKVAWSQHDLGALLTETAKGAKAKGLVRDVGSLLIDVRRKPVALVVLKTDDGEALDHRVVDLASGDQLAVEPAHAPLMVALRPDAPEPAGEAVDYVEDDEPDELAPPPRDPVFRDIFAFDHDPAMQPRIELRSVSYEALRQARGQFVFVLGPGAPLVLEERATEYAAVLPNVDSGLSRTAFRLLSRTLAEALLKWKAGQVFISLERVESLGEFVFEVDNWSASYAVYFVEPSHFPKGLMQVFEADVSRLLALVKAKHDVEEK